MGKERNDIKRWWNSWFGWALALLWYVSYFMLHHLSLFFGGVLLVLLLSVFSLWAVRQFSSVGALREMFLFIFLGVVMLILIFGIIYEKTGILDDSGNLVKDTLISIYFSIVTFTTLGYGDYRPSQAARWAAAFEAFLGYIFMGLFVVLVATTILRPDTSTTQPKSDSKDAQE